MEDLHLAPQNQTEVRNHSTEQMDLSNTEMFKICLFFVILVTGVIGNGLVMFVTGYKMKTTVNSICFFNLAIADFLFILVLIFYIIVAFHKNVWPFGNFMCKSLRFLTMQNTFASVSFLTIISLDRCLCTWVVVWAQNKRTLVKARIICAFVWLIAICCSIPIAIIYSVKKLDNEFQYCGPFTTIKVLTSLIIYRFMVGFLIPFLIILSSYIAIGVRVKRLKAGNQLRPFRIISVILVFLICWFPFHVQQLYILIALKNHLNVEDVVATTPFLCILIGLNSSLNPILYVFMCDEYKKKMKTSLLLVLEGAFTEDHLGLH